MNYSEPLFHFITDVLLEIEEQDCYGIITWASHGEFAPLTFFVNCNDLFWWATADAETLTPEGLPLLRQAIADVVAATGPEDRFVGFDLWCARTRKMRPQQPAYPQNERLRILFDVCGPVRDPKEEG